jgi:uncharacterized protein (DUF433 family)
MKLKDDILEKFEKGVTIFEIAREYNTSINAVLELLDLTRLDSNGVLTIDGEGNMEVHMENYKWLTPEEIAERELKPVDNLTLTREDFVE